MKLEVLPPDPPQKLMRIMSLQDLWSMYVQLKGDLQPSSRATYEMIARKFLPFMEGREFDPATMLEFVHSLQASGTIGNEKMNGIIARVKGFVKFLKTARYIAEDLTGALPYFQKTEPKEQKLFTEDQYNAVKNYCKDRLSIQPHLWLFILAYRTGMSLVDCCHLRWRNVVLNENGPSFIDIHRIKTKRHGARARCVIPVLPGTDIHEWLVKLNKVRHLNYKRADGIDDFVHQDCPGLYGCAFQRIGQDFKNIFSRSGIGHQQFKNLRPTFISNLVNSKAQTALICKMTGHQNMKTLLRYLKPDTKTMADELLKAFNYAIEETNERPITATIQAPGTPSESPVQASRSAGATTWS